MKKEVIYWSRSVHVGKKLCPMSFKSTTSIALKTLGTVFTHMDLQPGLITNAFESKRIMTD